MTTKDMIIGDEVVKIKGRIGASRFGVKFTTVHKVAKQILLDGWFTYDGRFIQPKAKSIGCGVYEVWAKNLIHNSN